MLRIAACLAACLMAACTDRGHDPASVMPDPFPTGTEGLPMAEPTQEIRAQSGDTVRLSVGWVAKWISGKKVRMLAYNRQIPGPTLKVPQGAEITLLLTNEIGLPTSLHSHGVRLEYRQDGMPGISQDPVDSGQTHAYRLRFPDPGLFWYHPHVREDYGLELGLYGNYFVVPADSAYWPPVNREVLVMLDDILLENGSIRPFYKNTTDFTMMGRFGNVMLVNGDTDYVLHVKRNEMIRFYFTNVTSARVFNLKFSVDYHLNVLGGDNGRYEYPQVGETEYIAPSERLIMQVYFDTREVRDTLQLWHWPSAPGLQVQRLFKIVFDPDTVEVDYSSSWTTDRFLPLKASIDSFRTSFGKPVPDQEVLLWGYMDHRKVKIPTHDPDATNRLGIEWYDHMADMNRASNTGNMFWFIQDRRTGKVNHDIHWKFRQGDQVLIRFHNDRDTVDAQHPHWMMHRMPHPIHFHGQRFLVVREKPPGGDWEENTGLLAWKDSHLIGSGFTVDLLLDASNLGTWMFHCHIPEHMQTDMMGHFSVIDGPVSGKTPYLWTLGLDFSDAAFDSLRQETTLSTAAVGRVSCRVNRYDPAFLEGTIRLFNVDRPALKLSVPLAAGGDFSFAAADLFPADPGIYRFNAVVKSRHADYEARPDTLRLTVDKRARFEWTLDLDLLDGGAFQALGNDTAATGVIDGWIAGRINGYQPSLVKDTVWIQLREYPDQNLALPLDAEGRFGFEASDLFSGQDGSLTLRILVKTKEAFRKPVPERITIHLLRGLAP